MRRNKTKKNLEVLNWIEDVMQMHCIDWTYSICFQCYIQITNQGWYDCRNIITIISFSLFPRNSASVQKTWQKYTAIIQRHSFTFKSLQFLNLKSAIRSKFYKRARVSYSCLLPIFISGLKKILFSSSKDV